MDPKQQINQLDPKLKEAYERVMGTPVGTTSPAQSAPPAPAAPTPAPTPPVTSEQQVMAPATPTPPNPPTPAGTPVMPHVAAPQPMPAMQMPAAGATAHVQQNPVANPFGMPQQPTAPAAPAQPQAKPGASSHGFVANKKGLHISPVILILGGIVFLLVYTVFWFKFFNIPLPFIGQ